MLRRFLSKEHGGDAIEIGCVPGNWMVYLNKEYGYRVSGIDYSEHLDYVAKNLELNDIRDFTLFHDDLFTFTSAIRYDLVFSSGFVEHFDDHNRVIERHAELAKPGGLVAIMVPNLTHVHRILCGMFAPDLLAKHRFPLMHRTVLAEALEKAGLEVLFCDYHKTFRPVYSMPPLFSLAARAVQRLLRMCRLDDMGNRFGSPYLISIARRPA